jgi:mono/diheme cytochrome c family protein
MKLVTPPCFQSSPRILVAALFALPAIGAMAAEAPSAASLYTDHCAQCHGADRLGAMGPALLPENLGRLKRDEALAVIRDGRTATQMPAFKDKLSEDQVKQLAELIYTPLAQVPRWDVEQMRASQVRHVKPGEKLADKPVFRVKDPLNLFIVVERDLHTTCWMATASK